MKREIKFRFWNKNTQAFEYDNLDSRETYQNPFSREDLIACQWTGLLDRVGKEIYEGDIVHFRYYGEDDSFESDTEVKWLAGTASFSPFSMGNKWRVDILDVEVIGNIYENPELLK